MSTPPLLFLSQAKASARDESAAATEAKRQEAESCVTYIALPPSFGSSQLFVANAFSRYMQLIRQQAERKVALEDAQNGLVIVKALCALPLAFARSTEEKSGFDFDLVFAGTALSATTARAVRTA